MLNAHPDLAIPHDSAELWLSARARADAGGALARPENTRALIAELARDPRIVAWQTALPPEALLADPLPSSFAGVMERFHTVYARAHGKRWWGDKNTGTLTELDQLNALFPTCRILHIVRDGRDCALSHLSRAYVYGYENVLRAAREWRDQVTLCRKMGAMLPADRYCELRYEDLVSEPARELERVCRFLGVRFAPSMLEYHRDVARHVPDERRGLWPLLDRPPVVENRERWRQRMRPGDRAVFERAAGPLLRALGYETWSPPVRRGRLRELWYELHSRLAWRRRGPAPAEARRARPVGSSPAAPSLASAGNRGGR
jgi:hypothetical protein